MSNNKQKKIYLVDYDDEFSFSKKIYKKNISFNRIAFIFFFFLFISLLFSVKIFYYGSISEKKISQTEINHQDQAKAQAVTLLICTSLSQYICLYVSTFLIASSQPLVAQLCSKKTPSPSRGGRRRHRIEQLKNKQKGKQRKQRSNKKNISKIFLF